MDASNLTHRLQAQWSCPSSDSEFYSVSSPETVSPTPSVDLARSPPHQLPHMSTDANPAVSKSSGSPAGPSRRARRSRLKNPSEQRQNASEKEKLRMRDLTKALHHLRTYLPPSVAPVGQTLTKIETLRLTIRYISYLSAQLGLSEEDLSRRKQSEGRDGRQSSPQVLGYFRWEQGQGHSEWTGQHQSGSYAEYPEQRTGMNVYDTQISEAVTEPMYGSEPDSFHTQQCAQLTPSCQVYGYQLVPQAFWS